MRRKERRSEDCAGRQVLLVCRNRWPLVYERQILWSLPPRFLSHAHRTLDEIMTVTSASFSFSLPHSNPLTPTSHTRHAYSGSGFPERHDHLRGKRGCDKDLLDYRDSESATKAAPTHDSHVALSFFSDASLSLVLQPLPPRVSLRGCWESDVLSMILTCCCG